MLFVVPIGLPPFVLILLLADALKGSRGVAAVLLVWLAVLVAGLGCLFPMDNAGSGLSPATALCIVAALELLVCALLTWTHQASPASRRPSSPYRYRPPKVPSRAQPFLQHQRAEARPCQGWGRGFESLRPLQVFNRLRCRAGVRQSCSNHIATKRRRKAGDRCGQAPETVERRSLGPAPYRAQIHRTMTRGQRAAAGPRATIRRAMADRSASSAEAFPGGGVWSVFRRLRAD